MEASPSRFNLAFDFSFTGRIPKNYNTKLIRWIVAAIEMSVPTLTFISAIRSGRSDPRERKERLAFDPMEASPSRFNLAFDFSFTGRIPKNYNTKLIRWILSISLSRISCDCAYEDGMVIVVRFPNPYGKM
ncbi:hypothetical protein L2E82_04708 [Cichorium intybus]|uniref:Uncharacterized protein n=1 Tax=Cichorium intybus TaxID=13427 RepID=A0ACB9H705_CICIN|nr:hypothetical protein L2E82_04708 [Cichorium intybus]